MEGSRMKEFTSLVDRISNLFDRVAGFCIIGAVLLVVTNVILRGLFNSPLLGVSEYVGFLTAVMIAFSLAYCAVQEGHIMIELLVKRLPRKVGAFLELLTNTLSFGFLLLLTTQLGRYAGLIRAKGQVSPTSEIAFYPFIYIMAIKFSLLALVVLVNSLKSLQSVVEK